MLLRIRWFVLGVVSTLASTAYVVVNLLVAVMDGGKLFAEHVADQLVTLFIDFSFTLGHWRGRVE